MATGDLNDVLTRAIEDLAEHGYDSRERLLYWQNEIRRAAERTMRPPVEMAQMLRDALTAVYRRLVERGGVLRYNPGVERFTLERVKPHLRAELDRRILASADLIRLNRERAIQQTLQRFSGWSTSIPKGGSDTVRRREEKDRIRRSVAGLPFEERRVLIDQGHKLTAAISQTVAEGAGAIAGIWRSMWRQPGYNYREDHKERDGNVYLLRDSWAKARGLVKVGDAGYVDEITRPAEEPFCRCRYTFLYHLRQLPDDMLTAKGRGELENIRMVA